MHIEKLETGHAQAQQDFNSQIRVSQVFKLPANKVCQFVLLNPPLASIQPRDVLYQLSFAKDGTPITTAVTLDLRDDSAVFVVSCKSESDVLDQRYSPSLLINSKIYKLTTTVYTKSAKKSKEAKITHKELTLKIPIKLTEGRVCLKNEISIEVPLRYNSKDEVGFSGIVNNAATCYMNSVFQILFNLGIFQQEVYSIRSDQHLKFPCTLQNLFYSLRHSRVAVSTQEIIRSFNWDTDQQAIQQDVQEFIMELLKALAQKAPDIERTISDLFEGTLENHIKNEIFDITNTEKFMDIQLNITKNINESLQLFVSSESLDGENAYNHELYGKQNAIKFHRFKHLPPILFINLKRYTYQDGGFRKINDAFEYYPTINFKDYMTVPHDQVYNLYAVLVHKGEAINHGHYYTFIRPFYESQQWFKFDDKIVSRVYSSEVFANNFGGQYEDVEYNQDLEDIIITNKHNPETAYMLVYIQEKKPLLLEPPNNFPEWILKREKVIQEENLQKKNYMTTSIFTLGSLNQIKSEIKSGIIYHKQASNAAIDQSEIDNFLEKYAASLTIPKTVLIYQILENFSALLNIPQDRLLLLLYRISAQKSNQEQIVLLNPSRSLQSYLNQKLLKWALILVSPDEQSQQQVNQQLTTEQISIKQQQQSNGKDSKHHYQDMPKQLFLIKHYNGAETKITRIATSDQNQLPQLQTQQGAIVYFQNDLDLKTEFQTLKSQDFYTIYVDEAGDLLQKFAQLKSQKEVILKVIGEQFYNMQIFQKSDTYATVLNWIANFEDCSPENIQIRYKDRKGNNVIAQEGLNVDELTLQDNIVSYRQTVVPVNALKEQFSFQIENQTYIVSKSITVQEFMEQEHYQEEVMLIQQKKDQKAASVILDKKLKLSKLIAKHNIKIVKPIVLGLDGYLVCFMQSVEIIQLRSPIVFRIGKDTPIAELVKAVLQFLEQNPVDYKTQRLTFSEEVIVSQDQDKVKKLEVQLRVKINGQEVAQDSSAPVMALDLQESQGIVVVTFLTIRDNKTDKLREKGVQIL